MSSTLAVLVILQQKPPSPQVADLSAIIPAPAGKSKDLAEASVSAPRVKPSQAESISARSTSSIRPGRLTESTLVDLVSLLEEVENDLSDSVPDLSISQDLQSTVPHGLDKEAGDLFTSSAAQAFYSSARRLLSQPGVLSSEKQEGLQAFLDTYWDSNQIYNQTDLASVRLGTAEAEHGSVRTIVQDLVKTLRKGKDTSNSLAEEEKTCRSKITELEQALQAEKEKLQTIESSQADLWRQVENDKVALNTQRAALSSTKKNVLTLQEELIKQVAIKDKMTAAYKGLQALFHIPSPSQQS